MSGICFKMATGRKKFRGGERGNKLGDGYMKVHYTILCFFHNKKIKKSKYAFISIYINKHHTTTFKSGLNSTK